MSDETSKGTNFGAYILLSEAIQFRPSEILEALKEDYPALDIGEEGLEAWLPDTPCDTADFITSPLMVGRPGRDCGIVSLIRLPGYGTWDPNRLAARQCRLIAEHDVMARNASYICVSVGSKGDSLTENFRAARLCSCLAAVFAKLPVALAVYWESGDLFLPPERVVEMADKAMADEWPLGCWVSFDGGQTAPGLYAGEEVGFGAFAGYDIMFAPAPVEGTTPISTIYSIMAMATGYGHSFKDGDTLGQEGQAREDSLRIRIKKREGQPDLMVLVHPQSPYDHEAEIGPMQSVPAPPGMQVTERGKKGFFKRFIRGARAH